MGSSHSSSSNSSSSNNNKTKMVNNMNKKVLNERKKEKGVLVSDSVSDSSNGSMDVSPACGLTLKGGGTQDQHHWTNTTGPTPLGKYSCPFTAFQLYAAREFFQ
ncbi:hypothetical protein STEG23_017069 [Scotinomys teguina]